MKKVKIAGSFLLAVCSVAAQGAEFRTTTFAKRWRDASANVEPAKASDADLRLDLAATDQTVLGFGVCASELSWNSLSALSEADRMSILDEMFSATTRTSRRMRSTSGSTSTHTAQRESRFGW